MRDCNLFPGRKCHKKNIFLIKNKQFCSNNTFFLYLGMALSCKETFSLLYYEHDGLNKEPPPWEPESYKLIDRIAADEGRFTSNSEVCIQFDECL